MGKVGCDIWEKWAGGQKKKARIKGEIWEKWGATYGRNGYKKRSSPHVARARLAVEEPHLLLVLLRLCRLLLRDLNLEIGIARTAGADQLPDQMADGRVGRWLRP